MNESNFAGLKYFPDQRLNIRQIENIDTKSILRGNVKDLLGVMNDLAYIDVENDEYVGGTPEAKKLYRLCQYGLQYMMYTVTKLGDNTLLLRDYLQIQDDKKKKLQELVNSQEETLRNLRQKKKTLQDTEKNYQNLLKTLNLENSSGDPRELRRFASFDSDPEGKEGSVPLHLPKGPHKRNQSREKSPGVSISYSNAQTGGPQNAGYDPRGYQQDPNYQSAQQYPPQYGAPQNVNYQYPPQYGASQPVNYQQQQPNQPVNYQYPPQYGAAQPVNYQQQQQPHRDIRETPRTEDNFQPNVPPRTQNETPPRTFNDYPAYQGQPAAVNRPGTSYGYEPASKGPEEQEAHKETDDRKFNQYTAGTVNNAQIRGPEPKKDDYDDDYEEDFELSESYVPDNSKIPSRFGKNRVGQNVLGSLGNSEKKPGDPEDTISMDFDKEFGKNYLDNLDRLVTKNKPGVEVPVKKYS